MANLGWPPTNWPSLSGYFSAVVTPSYVGGTLYPPPPANFPPIYVTAAVAVAALSGGCRWVVFPSPTTYGHDPLDPPMILIKRGTRAQLEAAKAAGELHQGEPYYVTDERRLAVGVAEDDYETAALENEMPDIIDGGEL